MIYYCSPNYVITIADFILTEVKYLAANIAKKLNFVLS